MQVVLLYAEQPLFKATQLLKLQPKVGGRSVAAILSSHALPRLCIALRKRPRYLCTKYTSSWAATASGSWVSHGYHLKTTLAHCGSVMYSNPLFTACAENDSPRRAAPQLSLFQRMLVKVTGSDFLFRQQGDAWLLAVAVLVKGY